MRKDHLRAVIFHAEAGLAASLNRKPITARGEFELAQAALDRLRPQKDLPGDCYSKHLGDGVTLKLQSYSTDADGGKTPTGVRINVERTITPEKFADVLCTAFEGGSNYWISGVKRKGFPPGILRGDAADLPYHHDWVRLGGTLTVWESCDGGPKVERILTLENLAAGCMRAAKHFGQDIEKWLEECPDANGADVALQFALLDEVVYG